MSDEQAQQPPAEGNAPPEPARITLKPSRNQKQRSRLKQSAESEQAVTPPPPPPPKTPAPAPPKTESEPVLRRMRLKRSGHLREDLLLPDKSESKRPEDIY